MKLDIEAVKNKVLGLFSNKQKLNKKKDINSNFSKKTIKKKDPLEKAKQYIISYFSKDKKVRRVMKQSERGVMMIVGAIIVGYVAYAFLYKPSVSNHNKVMDTYSKSENRRQDILTHLSNQSSLLKSIDLYDKKLNTYKEMYPNYRTQNEILKVISDLLAKEGVSPATFVKGDTKMAQKSVMLNFINNKHLQDKVKSYKYFGGVNVANNNNTNNANSNQPAQDSANGTVSEGDKSNFQYTEVSFSVVNITKQRALDIMDTFSKSKRVIIPESWNMSGDQDGKYRLEGTVLFFAYRDKDSPEPLF